MATKKIAYVDVNFAITVRVPVDYDDLPDMCNKEGEYLDATVTDEVWNKIVSSACDVMDGPDGSNVDSMVVSSIDTDDDDEPAEEEEDPNTMFDDCPEYVHDVAMDWLIGHATEYNDRDEAMKACKDDVAAEGYHVYSNCECEWAVEDAFYDYDGEVGWEE